MTFNILQLGTITTIRDEAATYFNTVPYFSQGCAGYVVGCAGFVVWLAQAMWWIFVRIKLNSAQLSLSWSLG